MENPFRPVAAATVNIDVSSSSQRVALNIGAASAVRVMNNGSATVWIEFGGPSVVAAVASGLPVGPGCAEVLSAQTADGSALYAAAIAGGSTGKIHLTPGVGL